MPVSDPGFAGYQTSVNKLPTITVLTPTGHAPGAAKSAGSASSFAPSQPVIAEPGGGASAVGLESEPEPPSPDDDESFPQAASSRTRTSERMDTSRQVERCARTVDSST